MRILSDIETSLTPAAVAQGNFELVDRDLYTLLPSLVAGVANTDQGPPAAGAWITADRYVDALGGEWACTAGGTPGTWIQIRIPSLTADPAGAIATGYVIFRGDLAAMLKQWDGTAWNEAHGTPMAAIVNVTGGTVIDVQSRAGINALLAALRSKGLLAP